MMMELIDRDYMNNGTCLYNSNPIPLNPELAFLLQDSDLAIILQQVHYWLNHNKQSLEMGMSKVDTYKEGRIWCFLTYEEWEKQFIWLSLRTIKRKIDKLVELGLLLKGEFNEWRADRTLWYSIDYKKLAELGSHLQEQLVSKKQEIAERKEKQKAYQEQAKAKKRAATQAKKAAKEAAKKAKCQNGTMQNAEQFSEKAKCQNGTMAKCQVGTSNNKRLTIQETNLKDDDAKNKNQNKSSSSTLTEQEQSLLDTFSETWKQELDKPIVLTTAYKQGLLKLMEQYGQENVLKAIECIKESQYLLANITIKYFIYKYAEIVNGDYKDRQMPAPASAIASNDIPLKIQKFNEMESHEWDFDEIERLEREHIDKLLAGEN